MIKINDDPKSVEFCNQKGDIMVGIGRNIHIIRHDDYLPKANIHKMYCMEFPMQEKEKPYPLEESSLDLLEPDAVRKIKNAKSSYLRQVNFYCSSPGWAPALVGRIWPARVCNGARVWLDRSKAGTNFS